MGVCFASDDLVNTDLDLALVVELAECFTEQPIFSLCFGTIEVLGSPCPYRLQYSRLRLGSDTYIVLAPYDELVYDVIAI
jgi:hypothetical protein